MKEDATASDTENTETSFEAISKMVSSEFEVADSLLEHNTPTFYLKQPQETKQPFLRLLRRLESIDFMALLRRKDEQIILRVVPKPAVKRSNVLINWILLVATVATTFVTGYLLSGNLANPIVGGAAFTIAIMAVLGTHEMGHKLTADKRRMDATPPYFIPGPPPNLGGFGTFGAVILQKSLPPNRDALFDIGSSGPVVGFVMSIIAAVAGLPLSVYALVPAGGPTLPAPLIFRLIVPLLAPLSRADALWMIYQNPDPGHALVVLLHPIAIAAWVGMLVTMLNLLPAAMLDGGHVSRSLAGERVRLALTGLSVFLLIFSQFYLMAVFVVFLALQRHPGPLDDVSGLSKSRKLMTILLIAIFILSFPLL